MTEPKIRPRRFDLHPDQFIAGIAGQLDTAEIAAYLCLVLQNYSKRGAVDPEIVVGLFHRKVDPRTIRAALDRLVTKGKAHRVGVDLLANGCQEEIEKAENRMRSSVENGSKGGRPRKENNNIEKPPGSFSQKPPAPPPSESIPSTDKRAPSRGTRLPRDWKPTQEELHQISKLGLVNGYQQRFLEDFTSWAWTSPKAVKTDWHLTLLNLARRKAEEWGLIPKIEAPAQKKLAI